MGARDPAAAISRARKLRVRTDRRFEGENMAGQDAWSGTVVRKGRALLDGSNLYRRLEVRLADGTTTRVRVGRSLWKDLQVGDRLVKEAGGDPRRA
ncbi:hypothetical protein GCM10023403_03330 [Pseudonocardia benzenivorans]